MFTASYKNHPGSDAVMPSGKAAPFFQPKLTINQPGDVYEQEADAMADKVMRMKDPAAESFFRPSIATIQRKCHHCEEEEKVQRKEAGDRTVADSSLGHYIGNLSGGQSLSGQERSFFEPRFGQDFSNVKLYTDSVAAKSAQSINALAYTSGNNIVFDTNQYQPHTDDGKKLLAHELTHVVQQRTETVQPKRIQRKCTPTELAIYNKTMHTFCDKPRACNMQTDTCATANAKIAAGYGCVALRTMIQQKCFKPGDPGYEDHMKQIAQASAALRNCKAVAGVKCAQEAVKVALLAAAAAAAVKTAKTLAAEAIVEATEAAEATEALEAAEALEAVEEAEATEAEFGIMEFFELSSVLD